MGRVLGLLLLVVFPQAVVADDPPANWLVKHTITLDQPATALAIGKSWAATGQPDGTVRVWSLETGKELAKLVPPGKAGTIRALTGAAAGTVLYGVEGESSGFRWDWSKPDGSRYARRTFEGRALDATPDGKRWAVFDGEAVKILEADLTADPFKPKVATTTRLTALLREDRAALLKNAPTRVHGHFAPEDSGFVCRIDGPPRKPGGFVGEGDELPDPMIRLNDRGEISYTA